MKTGTIYRIYHIETTRSYAGQTIQPIERYINSKLSHYSGCPKLFHAIQKHGRHTFTWEILESDVPYELLDKLECLHIRYWQCVENGYNIDYGGQVNRIISDETRKRLSASRRGKRNHFFGKSHSNDTKQKISEAKKGRLLGDKNPAKRPEVRKNISENNPMNIPEHRTKITGKNHHFYGVTGKKHPSFGRKHTEETKRKISEANKRNGNKPPGFKGMSHSNETKLVLSQKSKGNQNAKKLLNDKEKGQLYLFKLP